MKLQFVSLLGFTLLVSFVGSASADLSQIIDDKKIRVRFEKLLGELTDEGTTADPAKLQKQLSRKSTKVELTEAPALGETPLTDAEIYERASKATLVLGHLYKCDHCDEWHGSTAGGVVISPDGLVITNHHVMEADNAGAFGAMNRDGKIYPITEVLASSEKDDMALVQLDTGGAELDWAPLATGDAVGSQVHVISHPDGRFFTFSEGVIARYFVDEESRTPRMQITADYARGSSGCGVFNQQGELTAIVASTSSIYYNQDRQQQKNLQMVVKSCVPIQTFQKKLNSGKAKTAAETE